MGCQQVRCLNRVSTSFIHSLTFLTSLGVSFDKSHDATGFENENNSKLAEDYEELRWNGEEPLPKTTSPLDTSAEVDRKDPQTDLHQQQLTLPSVSG